MHKTIVYGQTKSIVFGMSVLLVGLAMVGYQIVLSQRRPVPSATVIPATLTESILAERSKPAPPKPLDPAMVKAGEELFRHEWTPHDPRADRGDGLGPVYNAASCAACHF